MAHKEQYFIIDVTGSQRSLVWCAETWSNFRSDAVIRTPQFNKLCTRWIRLPESDGPPAGNA